MTGTEWCAARRGGTEAGLPRRSSGRGGRLWFGPLSLPAPDRWTRLRRRFAGLGLNEGTHTLPAALHVGDQDRRPSLSPQQRLDRILVLPHRAQPVFQLVGAGVADTPHAGEQCLVNSASAGLPADLARWRGGWLGWSRNTAAAVPAGRPPASATCSLQNAAMLVSDARAQAWRPAAASRIAGRLEHLPGLVGRHGA